MKYIYKTIAIQGELYRIRVRITPRLRALVRKAMKLLHKERLFTRRSFDTVYTADARIGSIKLEVAGHLVDVNIDGNWRPLSCLPIDPFDIDAPDVRVMLELPSRYTPKRQPKPSKEVRDNDLRNHSRQRYRPSALRQRSVTTEDPYSLPQVRERSDQLVRNERDRIPADRSGWGV